MIIPAIPVLTTYFGVSAGAAAQIVTAFAVGRFVGMPIGGVVLDRLGARAALVGGPAAAAVAALAAASTPWFAVILVSVMVMGTGDSIWTLGREVAGIDLARQDQRGRVLSGFHGIHNIGLALGPLFGGMLAEAASFRAVFIAYAACAAVSVPLGFTTHNARPPRSPQLDSKSVTGWGLAPLLRRLQDEAPGTFHHSIIVGNLAERAAHLIGADALMVRVGCYYHDIGKLVQPGFYIENQMGGDNPHDNLDPFTSARIISEHVRSGMELARRYRLPPAIRAFVPEHHGTRLVAFFYRKAAQSDPDVDTEPFTYPGPKPQSKETAIVMLADSTEAVVRASEDRSPERIDALVDSVLAERLAEGQLDESDLTLREIKAIGESFKATLRGVYHPRIQYPEPTRAEQERQASGASFFQEGMPSTPPTGGTPQER